MAIRKRTTKSVAKRHDINYFKKGSPIRMWQWRVALVALVVAVGWIGISSARSATAFSAGPISSAHSTFGQQCATCHKPASGIARILPANFGGGGRNVPDSTCLDCHTVGPHHANVSTSSESCSSCHVEHIGAMNLSAAPVKSCADCHANLMVKSGMPSVAVHINTFVSGHPNFRALREVSMETKEAAFGLKFNHAEHDSSKGISGPNGTQVLECSYCHVVEPAAGRDENHQGRMANVDFEKSCRSCHSLDFDKRVSEQAPHSTADAALKFVQAKMQIAAPGDNASLVRAETILFRGKCALCHTVSGAASLPGPIGPIASADTAPRLSLIAYDKAMPITTTPTIAPSHAPQRFYTAAVFSHSAHGAVQCTECHAAALTSVSGKDLIMPSIGVCQKCHSGESRPQGPVLQSGKAESGCSLCHTYHEGEAHIASTKGNMFRVDQLTSSR